MLDAHHHLWKYDASQYPWIEGKSVLADVFSYDFGVGLEGVKVCVPELGCHLEANVEKLAEMLVVGRVFLVVTEGAGILLAGPSIDLFRARKLCIINVDDSSVGLTLSLFFLQRGSIDLFGESKSVPSCFSKADEFFQPCSASGFDMEAGSGACECTFNGLVDGELV